MLVVVGEGLVLVVEGGVVVVGAAWSPGVETGRAPMKSSCSMSCAGENCMFGFAARTGFKHGQSFHLPFGPYSKQISDVAGPM